MGRKTDIWLTYGSQHKVSVPGWTLWVTSATISAPHPWAGETVYRFAMSRNDYRGPWMDKNPLGRKLDTRFFMSKAEALSAAKAKAEHKDKS